MWNYWSGKKDQNLHIALKGGVEHLIKESMIKKSLDNVTGILVGLSHLESFFEDGSRKEGTVYARNELLEEMKQDMLKESAENIIPPPLSRVGLGLNSPSSFPDTLETTKLKSPSRGLGYQPRSNNDTFDFSKYMESNVRRSSDALPKINYTKNKGL